MGHRVCFTDAACVGVHRFVKLTSGYKRPI